MPRFLSRGILFRGKASLITHDRALAEDIVQAAFIRAYERIEQFDTGRPFGPWFLRSVSANGRAGGPFTFDFDLPLSPDHTIEVQQTVEATGIAVEVSLSRPVRCSVRGLATVSVG